MERAQRPSAERCAHLSKLGVHANPSERGPEGAPAYHSPRGHSGWIEVADGPIRWVGVPGFGTAHCYVPEPRMRSEFDFGYTKVYSVRVKRWPVFGPVVGTKWEDGSGGAAGPRDYEISEAVADWLNLDVKVSRAIVAANIDVTAWAGDGDCWILDTKSVMLWTAADLACYVAIAQSLLSMPIPEDM